MKGKIEKIIIFSASIIITMMHIFIFGLNLSLAQNSTTSKVNESIVSDNQIKSGEADSDNANKILEAATIKLSVANEKEAAYEKAINELKYYVTFFGTLLIIIVMVFGYYKNNKIVEAKEELNDELSKKAKFLEESNSLNIDKKLFELEKNNNISIKKIEESNLGNIKDLQARINVLEGMNKIDPKSINMEENKEDELPLEDENPYGQ
ncbi:MAG: hypothetical protein WCX23_02110 [Candidatus Paceibacterota bacterium]|jgi:hypothetical protein|nr:hypothetical protein [Candidatus Paceibacterota bacterium]MDD4875056.1 hypothetical protein [Candidatus Paceibacterota bacterium]